MIRHPWRPFTTRDGSIACADCYLAECALIHRVNDHDKRLATSGPIIEDERDWRELWQVTGGEAGGA